MFNSIESERLQRLIDLKTAQYEKLKSNDPDNKALLYLSSEITLLRDTIMPIVLCNTTVDYSEIRNHVTQTIRSLERHPLARRINDLLIHFHLKDPGIVTPLAALSSNLRITDTIVTDLEINGLSEQVLPFYFAQPIVHRIDYNDKPEPLKTINI